MVAPMDRRKFLGHGAKAAAAVAAVGAGGSLLAACGGSSGGGTKANASGGTGTSGRPQPTSTGQPKAGGTLNWGMWSEVDGFDPAQNHWDATGLIYAHTFYDSLGILMPDGTVAPYLAKSIDHNADYTEWRITARDGVTFHDGEKFNGDAIMVNINTMRQSALAGPALTNVADVKVDPADPMTAVVTMKSPWVPFDTYLTGGIGGQMAYMVSPKAIKAKSVPKHPVGTGPFVFESWTPGDKLVAKKNPNYWQQGKPYLDGIVFKPIADSQQRGNSLKAGNVDMIMVTSAQNVLDFKGDKNFSYQDSSQVKVLGEQSPIFYQINCLSDPLKDVRLRQALAYATDQEKLIKIGRLGVGTAPINGPFTQDSPYYTDTGYPTKPDTAKSKQLIAAWSKDNGGKKPAFHLGTTNDPEVIKIVTLTQAMWQDVGFDVTIDQVEQAQYITNCLVGKYDCYIWTQFAAADPDANYIWWSTKTVGGIGSLSLNFARNSDDQIEADLEKGRTSTDPKARAAAYQDISKRFAQDFPYIWYGFSPGGLAASPKVQDWAKLVTPDGKEAANLFSNQAPYTVNFWLQA